MGGVIAMLVVDGTDLVLGRVASRVAKRLLAGEEVSLVNAEKLVISGNPEYTYAKYLKRRGAHNKSNPEHSPHWPRRPDMLVRRIVRGMLPWQEPRGRQAFKLLRVYIGVPGELSAEKAVKFDRMDKGKLFVKYVTIKGLCQHLGWQASS